MAHEYGEEYTGHDDQDREHAECARCTGHPAILRVIHEVLAYHCQSESRADIESEPPRAPESSEDSSAVAADGELYRTRT